MNTYFTLEPDHALAKSPRDYAYLDENFGTDRTIDLDQKLWNCEPLDASQYKIKVAIPNKRQPADYLLDSAGFLIFSERLTNVLIENHVHFNAIPVEVTHGKQEDPVPVPYNLINLLDKYSFVNARRSRLKTTGFGGPRTIILTHSGKTSGILMGRDIEFPPLVLVHKDLLEAMQRVKISGCLFEPCQDPL